MKTIKIDCSVPRLPVPRVGDELISIEYGMVTVMHAEGHVLLCSGEHTPPRFFFFSDLDGSLQASAEVAVYVRAPAPRPGGGS